MSEMSFNSNTVLLQSYLCSHITSYRLKKTSLIGKDSCNNYTIIILIYIFFNENDYKDLKILTSSCIAI